MTVPNVKMRLDAWREAERRRDVLALGSAERQEAEESVANAKTAYRAEFAQAFVRYAEQDFQDRHHVWSGELERVAIGAESAGSPRW